MVSVFVDQDHCQKARAGKAARDRTEGGGRPLQIDRSATMT
jgi:hypothetical protein